MSKIAIHAQGLSKQYRITGRKETYKTLRSTLSDALVGPVCRLRKLLCGQADGANAPYKTIWALKDVSFEVKRGEVIGIIGRNGAGKSTLLKILARITEPTEGYADIRGRIGSLLEVGTGFHPELSGRENLYLNGAILGMKKKEINQKFDEIVAFAEIEKFIDTPVKYYSSGMYVRLAFAVAAHLEPEILLVDEVLAVGDVAFQKKCLGKIENVASEGRTVVVVSHNMASIRKLCKGAYWIDEGKVREFGLANTVVDLYEKALLYNSAAQSEGEAFQEIRIPDHCIDVRGIDAFIRQRDGTASLIVEIQLCATRPLARLGINVYLTTIDGIMVCKIGSRVSESLMENMQGDYKCIFEFENITGYLAGGKYLINIAIKRPQFGKILHVENAASVQIPPVDVYNVGKYFYSHIDGLVPLPVKFFCFKEMFGTSIKTEPLAIRNADRDEKIT